MRVILLTVAIMAAAASAQSCSSYTTCYTCTATAASGNCGWCANTNTCSQGTANGPSVGSCVSWDWLASECPATPAPVPTPPANNCASYSDCNSCTTQPPGGNCGWCASSYQCLDGTSTGPSVGSCPSWDWTSNLCPAQPPTPVPTQDHCPSYYNCTACTQAAAPYCGWCASSNQCMSGSSTGPSMGSCPSWDWTSNLCPASEKATRPKKNGKLANGKEQVVKRA